MGRCLRRMDGLGGGVRRFGSRFQLARPLALGCQRLLTGFPPVYDRFLACLQLLRDFLDLLAFLNQLEGLCLLGVCKSSAGRLSLLCRFLRWQFRFWVHGWIFVGWKTEQCIQRWTPKATFRETGLALPEHPEMNGMAQSIVMAPPHGPFPWRPSEIQGSMALLLISVEKSPL